MDLIKRILQSVTGIINIFALISEKKLLTLNYRR